MSDTTGGRDAISGQFRPGNRIGAGRKPSQSSRPDPVIDPAAAAAAAGDPAEPGDTKRRSTNGTGPGFNPPGGTKSAGTKAGASLDLSAAAGLLQGFHAVLAMSRGPHWLLNDADAKAYGTALANALRHLPITMAQKYIDFSALGLAVVAYEGPRIGMDVRIKAERMQRGAQQPPPPAQIFRFRPTGAQPNQPAPLQQPAPNPGPPGPVPPAGPLPLNRAPDMTYEPELEPAG